MSQAFPRAMARPLVAAALLGALALPGSTAFAASATPSDTGGKKVPTKVTFINAPSSETPAAREKRLRRECKGRPNAGACLGYTR